MIIYVFLSLNTLSIHTIFNTLTIKMSVISIVTPSTGARKSNNLIVVVDKSGSMCEAANSKGEGISRMFSKNDLSKHSIEIVARSLSDDDTLEIITYDSVVATLLPRTRMNTQGKEAAITAIKRISPGGGTALWDGLKTAMNAAKKTETELGDACVIMITDGVPSSSPRAGEVAELKSLRSQTENTCRLHTIGLGYEINSSLLYDLANDDCGGSFIFIPDGSMTITAWVNLLANEMSIVDTKVRVMVDDVLVNTIGTVKYGQPFNVHLNTAINPSSTVSTQCKNEIVAKLCTPDSSTHEVIKSAALNALKNIIRIGKADLSGAKTILQTFVKQHNIHSIPIMDDLLGQVAEGLASENARNKWGMHHIRSLVSAHTNQNCLNFKDPGPMAYNSEYIETMRDMVDVVANSIDPPVPSLSYGNQQIDTRTFAQSFNNQSGGCFGGYCYVLMNDGSYKYVKDIQAGDIVYGAAKVLCVVTQNNCNTVSIMNNLCITPWHPVNVNGKWIFPDNITNSGYVLQEVVYNFVLDTVHTIIVNSTIACTLGHGFKGDVIEHDFYGTQKVHDSLQKFPSYSSGVVHLSENNVVRSNETGCVCDYTV